MFVKPALKFTDPGQFVIRDFAFAFQFVQCRDDAVQLIGLGIFLADDKLASRSRVLCTESPVVFSPGHHHRLGQIPGFASRYHVTRLVYFETTSGRSAFQQERQIKGWSHRVDPSRLPLTLFFPAHAFSPHPSHRPPPRSRETAPPCAPSPARTPAHPE